MQGFMKCTRSQELLVLMSIEVAIVAPPMEDGRYRERAYFNHKKYHSINVQLVCDSAMHILNVNSRYPGRTHDAFIYANSNVRAGLVKLATHQGNQNVWLLGNSGYPPGTLADDSN